MLIFILCIEFLACMHTKVCHSYTHNTKGKADRCCILLIYCTVLCKYCKGTKESVWTLRNLILKLCLYSPAVLQQCTAKGWYNHYHHFHTNYDVQKQYAFFKMVNNPNISLPLNKVSPLTGSSTLVQKYFVIKYINSIFQARYISENSHARTSAPLCMTNIFQVHFLWFCVNNWPWCPLTAEADPIFQVQLSWRIDFFSFVIYLVSPAWTSVTNNPCKCWWGLYQFSIQKLLSVNLTIFIVGFT